MSSRIPKRRLCVDNQALNNLLTPVKKAHSKAKGVLTLVPLPKIDKLYGRLQGSTVYPTLDMRSGYYHIELTKLSRAKSAFVSPLGKWEFKRCLFGLAKAPAYFQRLMNEVLPPFDFAFGYLDDILIYSPDIETHLKHLEMVFQRLRETQLKLKMYSLYLPPLGIFCYAFCWLAMQSCSLVVWPWGLLECCVHWVPWVCLFLKLRVCWVCWGDCTGSLLVIG